ncbi:AMIN-like domain-containing (lipo)protein [Parenemella sanctibonifatiensis]|uniref:AMIN-like domain-containing protein n=1 Tax=Parenemella sanctibonifatiensis TaxID=2016505 RepID=A0A255EPC3_9ACTN|nr:hypothetical protein [Parenemella sanctibonifatiensis]OYN91322.1 hypothetical protein CGZ91_07765 [Parenemella sanctibonifatiensis]
MVMLSVAPARRLGTALAALALVCGIAGCDGGTPTEPVEPTSPDVTTFQPSATPSAGPASSATPTSTGPSPAPSPSSPPASTPADEAPSGAPFTTGPSESAGFGSEAGGAHVAEVVRCGQHESFDRVVVEYRGEGGTQWHAQPADGAYQSGSGRRLDVAGDRFLTVVITGVTNPENGWEPPALLGCEGGVLRGIQLESPYEGQQLLHLGLDRDLGYRISVLDDPRRVVIDIAHD